MREDRKESRSPLVKNPPTLPEFMQEQQAAETSVEALYTKQTALKSLLDEVCEWFLV